MQPSNDLTTETPDYSARLATVEMQVGALADTTQVVEELAGALDYLYDTGADSSALQVVSDNASMLLETNQQLDQALKSLAEIARTVQQQRDATRQALTALKAAIEDVNTNVPEIAELYDTVSETVQEDVESYMLDVMWEILVDHITTESPLSYSEAVELTDLLTGGLFEQDHPIWQELRDWINHGILLIEEGIPPQPEDEF